MSQDKTDDAKRWALPVKQKRAGETRDRLLTAGFKLLRRKRFDELSVADIARAAGCSVGVFYVRFVDKEQFFLALAGEFRALARQKLETFYAESTRASLIGDAIRREFGIVEDFTGYLLDPVHGDRRLQRHRFASLGYQLDVRRPLHRTLDLLVGGAWQGDLLDQQDARVDATHQLLTRNWELYDGQHVVFQPARMSVEELQRGIETAWRYAYSVPSMVRRLAASPSPWPVRLGTNLGYRFYAHNLHRFYNCDWILGMGRARSAA